jgi:glycine cleavage system H protein
MPLARFTTDHEWVKFDPATNEGTVGVTNYAQKALGDVVFVELPQSGTEIAQGGESGLVGWVLARD